EKDRAPLVLCYLEGKSQDEAAGQLGWSKGTLRGRLERGRKRLRGRLSRRGLSLPAGLFATALGPAAVPRALAASAPGAASRPAAAASREVVTLAEGVTRTMFATKLKIATGLLLALGLLSAAGYLPSAVGQKDPGGLAPARQQAPESRKPQEDGPV